ncbi:MAG: hypothetical protein AB1540_10425 [Bdellovibrionota bacterium]
MPLLVLFAWSLTYAAPPYEFKRTRQYGVHLPGQSVQAAYDEINMLLLDHDLDTKVKIFWVNKYPNQVSMITAPLFAREVRDLLARRGFVWLGDFTDLEPEPIRSVVADQIRLYEQATQSMVEFSFRNLVGVNMVLSQSGELLPSLGGLSLGSGRNGEPLHLLGFGEVKPQPMSSAQLRAHYESEEKRLRELNWPAGYEELEDPAKMNETESNSYKLAKQTFFNFFGSFTEALVDIEEEGLKKKLSSSTDFMNILRALAHMNFKSEFKDEPLRNEIMAKINNAGSLTEAQAAERVSVEVAESILHSAMVLFYDARYSPLYSELTAILADRSIDKVLELVGPEQGAWLIQKNFVPTALHSMTERPEHLGYFGQKLLHRLSKDAILPPLVRVVAAALLARAQRDGKTMHVPVLKAEQIVELYANVAVEGLPIVVKVRAAGGSRKRVHLRSDNHEYDIDRQIRMLDAEIRVLGATTHDWESVKKVELGVRPARLSTSAKSCENHFLFNPKANNPHKKN